MKARAALLATTLLASPALAHENYPISGLYVAAGVGLNWAMDSDVTLSGDEFITGAGLSGSGLKGTTSFDMGWGALASLGWGFGNGLRAELEVGYRTNDVSDVTGFDRPGSAVTSSGSMYTWSVMANVMYDFVNADWPIIPYVGLGLGVASTNWDDVRQSLRADPADYIHIVGTNTSFAYQAILGASLPLDSVTPGLALTAEYRFFGTLANDRDAFVYSGGSRFAGQAETETFYHSILVGLRYGFGNPPPPPPPVAAPAAAPAPARTFLVFFDFDRADLTDRARQIIGEAATNAQRTGTTRIEVAGHADRAGTPQYNQALSERRAAAVAAELERRGVPRSAMVIQAFGESRPLVPTADGVREPQNRRVEIVLR